MCEMSLLTNVMIRKNRIGFLDFADKTFIDGAKRCLRFDSRVPNFVKSAFWWSDGYVRILYSPPLFKIAADLWVFFRSYGQTP